MNQVLAWTKSNIFIVIFIVLMIASLSAMPFLSGTLSKGVKDEVRSRAAKYNELKGLEKTSFSYPAVGAQAESQQVLINPQLLERYESMVNSIREDAEQVTAIALEHNRKERGVLLPEIFPAPPMAMREVLPQQFHELLVEAYRQQLVDIGAGMPPSKDYIRNLVQRRQAQFITQTAAKDSTDQLTDEERDELIEVLVNERISRYAEAAEKIQIYASVEQLDVPVWDPSRQRGLSELFSWQWQLWVVQDILNAFHAANRDDSSVMRAPVKHVLWITPLDIPQGAAPSAGPGAGPLGGGRTMSGGGAASMAGAGGRSSGRGGAAPAASAGGPDYTASFTGRKSTNLYDVVRVSVGVIVDSGRVPDVLDALARWNFITILDLSLTPIEPQDSVEYGYHYGYTPISRLELLVETIWLREWTMPFMPDELKQALGIATAQPDAAGQTAN